MNTIAAENLLFVSGLATIIVMNIVLLYRVLIGDFFNGKKSIVSGCSNGNATRSAAEASKSNGVGKNGFHSIDSLLVRSLGEEASAAGKKFQ